MNSGPAGGPGQPPAGLQPTSTSSSRDQHGQGHSSDPSGLVTIMNITVPPVIPVPPGLRFVHPAYMPPPPHPHPATAQAVSVAQVSQVTSNSASPVSVSSGPTSIVQQQVSSRQHPPSVPSPASGVTGATAAYSRDPYRNSSPNVNDRVAIGVSSSPASSQVVGVSSEYINRGDRPRISLLTSSTSIPPSASPTTPADYVSRNVSRSNSSVAPTLVTIQPQEYRPGPVEMAQMQQDSPPFKKIRLGQPMQQMPSITPSQQQQTQQTMAQTECQRISGIQETIKPKPVQLQPLRIDTRPSAGAYTPQTEAISPTLPEPTTQEDMALKITKDDLLSQLTKLDNEISTRETRCMMLRKKLKELEDSQSEVGTQPAEETLQPKHQSIEQKIYAENRKKAEDAHKLLEKLGPIAKLPLYNQPSDTSAYHENRRKYQWVKVHLVKRLRKEHMERFSRHNKQSQQYAQEVQEWHRKVEKLEAAQKRKTKEAKNREFFEKIFPELRKQREDKERFNRVGARIKSEADLEEIMDGLQEQELEDKKMRSYVVIPPLLLDKKQRKIAFRNRNGLLQPEELEAFHSEKKLINVWSKTEHDMFKEKYLQHPKNFGIIAQSFEHKSVSDCVHRYYITKKAENYKQLLRKSRRTRSSRNNPNNKVNNSNSTIGPIDILTTGVTTRLQREQQQKTQENPQNSSSASAIASSSSSAATTTTTASTTTASTSQSTTTSASSTAAVASSSSSSSLTSSMAVTASSSSAIVETSTVSCVATTTITTSSSSSVATASASVPSTSATTTTSSVLTTSSSTSVSAKDAREANKENKDIKIEPKDTLLIKEIKEESQSSSETLSGREIKIEGKSALSSSSSAVNANNATGNLQHEQKDKKKNAGIGSSTATSRSKDKKKENHAAPMETSDEETQECGGRQLGPHPCAICQTTVEAGNQSRPLPRSHASQYGLREEQVAPGARVCNNCRCKSVRGRYTACPLPSCPNLNKTRVKRLRALPSKWNELPAEVRDPIIQEFQIPSNVTKCCSACFNRISRRLAPHFSGSGETAEDLDAASRQWADEELELLRKALRENGTNWPKVSEQIPGKTNHQCKTYYFNHRRKLGLDQVVAEYYQSQGEERRPCLTDEEESGSTTSSCDELAVHDSSDTASAGSPANTLPSSTPTSTLASSSTVTQSSSGGNGALSMGFSQTQETKVGEKLADVAVVSLVAPSPMSSSQTPQTNPPTSTREDYDSSATETADEGQSGTDLDNSGVMVTFTTPAGNSGSSATPAHPSSLSIVPNMPHPVLVQSPPSAANGNNPLTVKDLMLGVIEMQLKRSPSEDGPNSSVPVSSGTPTISSILKTDHRNDISFGRDYKSASQVSSISNTAMSNRDANLATLSVVSGPHGHRSAPSPQQIAQMQATITPCPPSTPNQQPQPSSQDMLPNEGLVVMQAQQAMRETEGTLDLSIKKPRQQQEYNHALQPPPSSHKPATMSHYRNEPAPPTTHYYSHGHPPQEPQGRGAKSPHVYVSSPRPQAPLTPKLANKVTAVVPPHPKLSPKLSNMSTPHKTGSITHGTPVANARYDGLLRQMTPPGSASQPNPSPTSVGSKEGGSITQGTPVHPFAVDKRSSMYDYRSIRHSPVTTSNVPVQAQNSGVVVSHGQSSQYNSYPPRQTSNYTVEQLASRQILMNDYITSQQMHSRNRGSGLSEPANKNESPATLFCASTPPPQSHQQPRQGVIQRHNTQKHYAPPPPGLEAFSSLVDVAVQQPSLPVPHQPASSGGHESLYMSIDRMYADRHSMESRSLQNIPRIARQQYQMALSMQREEQQQRERDMLIREKQEEEQQQRLQREKEQQQQQQMHHQQQMERMQREKEMQQQQEHRMAQQREQELHQAAVAQAAAEHRIAVQQRDKEIQQQQEHRLSMHQQQQQREKDMQQQHYRLVQHQREKEMQMAAAQREKEHQEHRLAVQQQREKELQQQQEIRLAQQKREKELQQQADHRALAMHQQRENMAYLQHQQQRYQKQQIQHMQQQQQRMEAEQRRQMQIYKDQQDHYIRELAESRQCESPSMSKGGGFYQPSRHPQQTQPPPTSSRHAQSSSNQQGDSSTLTAASLIDAIITHQINQTADTSGGNNPAANNQPTRPGDRLFQSFHRDSPSEPNGMAHSPAGEENANSGSGSGSASNNANKGLTLGEHVDHIVNKDYGPMSSYRPYSGYPMPEDWKRRKGGEPDSVKSGDERQIIRVAQPKPPSSQAQSTHQSQHSVSKQSQPQFQHEPVSPPEPTTNHYSRRFYEPSTATTTTPVTPSSKSHLSPLDYVKNKIVEVMRTAEDDKLGSGGDRNGGSANEKDDKCADSSPGGEMVIDESPREQQPPQPPAPTPTTFYPFNALGVHTGPPPAPPPTSAAPVSVVKSEEPAPLLSAQYEPLSDED